MTATHRLSNGRYTTVISDAGAGYSAFGEICLTRWSADNTRDADGCFLYLRDLDSGLFWSAGHQPVQHPTERYEVQCGGGAVVITRQDAGIETRTEIRVASNADVEWRRYTLINLGLRRRRLDLTTYVEVALNTLEADAGHPAFSKLFVQTEYLAGSSALLARRRQRTPEEKPLFLLHALLDRSGITTSLEFETDRARFIGRGYTLANPQAMLVRTALSGAVGSVLDPILSLRCSVILEPGQSVQFDTLLGAGSDRALLERMLAEVSTGTARDRIFGSGVAGSGATPPRDTVSPAAGGRRYRPAPSRVQAATSSEALQFFNGYGGFNASGDEYVIRLDRTGDGVRCPPLPWTNVIANESAGFVASERNTGFTWAVNSRLNRLTPWLNDPVCDPSGEAIYIRDEDAGLFWSPTPGPVPGSGAYETRHGFGYTTYRHASQDLSHELVCFVPRDAPAKIFQLKITNDRATTRRLSLFFYVEWVLGALRSETVSNIITEFAAEGRVQLAMNPAAIELRDHVAFAAVAGPGDDRSRSTADRAGFLGYCGTVDRPEAVASSRPLDGRCGQGLDQCAAFQIDVVLAPHATAEWSFVLGHARNREAALQLAEQYRVPSAVDAALHEVRAFWREILSGVHVDTPSPALDLMVNGWLNYQNLSCRIWARTGFYQSGGAFGFRDQLQDSAALVYLAPHLTRRQILIHAGSQFPEGDVLHWWHPAMNQGLRTKFSDDLLWLPYITLLYVAATGDRALLDEHAGFVTAEQLGAGVDEVLVAPALTGTTASVYEHCCLAIDRSLTKGRHGLPLMGTGDWNDGMNRVGRLGRGESVWLGFFLYTIIESFAPLCEQRGDTARATRYREYRMDLGVALNDGGWDGEWYRRAWYDDGSPLGSGESDECQIDALAQAWAVLSGAAPKDRACQALDAMERLLVDEPLGLIRLLTPPFDRTLHDPGYIKGYLPGIRENGGQYTHAALWAVRAVAEAGRSERAVTLLDLLNPVRHGDTAEHIAVYKTEPYVVAADVYGIAPHTGRGGWTWYTGSAAWMFRVALESILGITLADGKALVLRPCIPAAWPGFAARYRLPDGKTVYEIRLQRTSASTSVQVTGLDAHVADGAVRVPLIADGRTHRVNIELGDDINPSYRPRISP